MAGLITVPQIPGVDEGEGGDLVLAAGAGFGAAMATRPIARTIGRRVGARLDARPGATPMRTDLAGFAEGFDNLGTAGKLYHEAMAEIIKSSRQAGLFAQDRINSGDYSAIPNVSRGFQKRIDPMIVARSKAYNTVDGRQLTGAEADLGVLSAAFGDNLVQALVQLGLGSVLINNEIDTME